MQDIENAVPLDHVAVVIVDIQEKLFEHIFNKEEVLANVAKVISFCKRLEVPLLVTEQYPQGLGETLPALRELLADDYQPIPKTVFSCYGAPDFVRALDEAEVETVVLVGIETHICVMQTALSGLSYGAHDMIVLADCVGSRAEMNHALGLDRMRDEGVIISSMEMFFYELLGEAKTAEHKLVFDLLK
jgi:nicotinamidase-related amidase